MTRRPVFVRRQRNERVWPYLAPALIVLLVFTYGPAFLALVASLFDVSITSDRWEFVGLGNYRTAISDPDVASAAVNTLWYSLMTALPSIALGLGLALAVDGLGRGRGLARTLLFLPMTANLVAMSIVFSWIFAYQGGFANALLALVGIGPLNFLGDSSTALPTVAALGLWRATSFNLVVYAAGLTTIPNAIHQACAVDGVRGWAKLRKVLWPLLAPSTVFVSVITFVQAIQVFDTVAVMTGGGPLGATETLLFLVWRLGFQVFRLGYASAIAFLMLVAIVILGLARSRFVIGRRAMR
jgi:multiple sugar transport system permease protein